MVEKEMDKKVGNTTEQTSKTYNATQTTTNNFIGATAKKYSWMMEGEQVVAEINLKYALTMRSKKDSSSPGSSKLKKERVKGIKKAIATNYRIAYVNKNDELFSDKKMTRYGYSSRSFFFHDKNALEKFLAQTAERNQKIVEDYKKSNPKFAKADPSRGTFFRFAKKLIPLGYTADVYLLTAVVAATEKEYEQGNVGAGFGKKLLKKTIGATPDPMGFFDGFKKGFAMQGKQLDIARAELTKTYKDKSANKRAALFKFIAMRPAGFFLRPSRASAEDLQLLVSSIIGNVNEMEPYSDRNYAVESYTKYLRTEGKEQ